MSPSTRAQDTRTRLLDAGVQAFLENGFHGTGIKAVLDQVGVPKGSFYNYFDSKEAFGAATVEHYAQRMGERLATARKEASDPLEGLRTFFLEEMRGFEEAKFVGGCLVTNLGAELEGSAICREALATALSRYIGGITSALADAQASGRVRNDLSAGQLARLLVDAWEGAVIRMKIERTLEPLEQCLALVLDRFLIAQ